MTAQSLAEATGLFGFAVSVLAANGSGLRRDKVISIGQFMQSHPHLALIYLRKAEGCSQKEIGDELGLTQTQVSMVIHRELNCMASLLDPCVVV